MIRVYSWLGFARIARTTNDADEQGDVYRSNNFTLINLWLCWFGAKDERTLCHQLLRLQCGLSFLALAVLTVVKIDNE